MNNYDGEIVIGTRIDTKQLEASLKELTKKLKNLEEQSNKLQDKKIKIEAELEGNYKQQMEELAKEYNKSFSAWSGAPEWGDIHSAKGDAITNGVYQKKIDEINSAHQRELNMLDNINKKLKENAAEQEIIKQSMEETTEVIEKRKGFENFLDASKNINRSLTQVIKKVARWGLALFGVRSAYMAIRSALNTITSQDKQLAANIQYMKNTIAYALEPVIRWIINGVYELLRGLQWIIYVFTKKNIFKNANKGLETANKNAKKLLATFDEITTLDKGEDGNVAPTIDLSKMDETQKPKWVEWIEKNKEIVEAFGVTLGLVFGAVAMGKILGSISNLINVGLSPLLTILLAIAAPIIITITLKKIKQVIKQAKELKKQLEGITEQQELLRVKNKEVTDTFWDLYEQGELNKDQIESYINMTLDDVEAQADLITKLEEQKTWLGKLTGTNKELTTQQEIANERILDAVENYKKLYDEGLLNEDQQKKYKTALEKAMDALDNQGVSVKNLQEDYKKLTGQEYKIKLKATADTTDAENVFTKLKNKLSSMFGGLFSFGSGGSGGYRAKGGIYYPSKIPKLASGGIINQPGRGIPYHGATIGERGAEAVVPLTDSQQMSLLGEAIGRFVRIDNFIDVNMDSRKIKRIMQESDERQRMAGNV